MNDDIQAVRTMLAPANPCPPGSLAGAGRDDTGRAAFTRVTASGTRPAVRSGLRAHRMSVRLVAVGGLSVAIAAGATGIQSLGGTDEHGNPRQVLPGLPAGPVANAQAVLRNAASAAQARPFTPPRPGQWTFIETRYRRYGKPDKGEVFSPASRPKPEVDRIWTRADGKKAAFYEDGKLVISNTGGAMPPSDYASVAALPRDPDALLAYIRDAEIPNKLDVTVTAFQLLGAILAQNVLPPAQEAAIYRAMAKIPGVELDKRATDAQGRPALSISLLIEDWVKYEVLLDPGSYAYRGHRSTVVKDHAPDGASGGMFKKGTIESESVRITAGFVDRPGQRP